MTSEPVSEGEILAGKYRVDRVLGAGGMGTVVAAHHIDLDEKVAIKFLHGKASENAEAVARFSREARAAVKIKSEHVARVTDVARLGNGAPYMVMEYLDGSDLSDWLRRSGRLSVAQAVEFVLQASEAVAEAHSLGIVHRDLKPANLFVIRRPDGTLSVKVLDFGISKVTSAGARPDAVKTSTTALMGSPLYMSPEQMQSSKNVDARSDIWALGVILHELVTGTPPFTGDTMTELILRVVSAEPPTVLEAVPDAPPGFDAVILRCLEKDPRNRFQSVAELAVALLPFAPARSRLSVERVTGVSRGSIADVEVPDAQVTAVYRPAPAGAAAATEEIGSGEPNTTAPWGRTTLGTRRGSWLAFAGIGLLVVVGATLFFEHESRTPTLAAAPAASAPVDLSAAVSAAPVTSNPPLEVAPASAAAPSAQAPAVASSAPAPSAAPHVVPRVPKKTATRKQAVRAPAPARAPAKPRPKHKPAKSTFDWGGRL